MFETYNTKGDRSIPSKRVWVTVISFNLHLYRWAKSASEQKYANWRFCKMLCTKKQQPEKAYRGQIMHRILTDILISGNLQ